MTERQIKITHVRSEGGQLVFSTDEVPLGRFQIDLSTEQGRLNYSELYTECGFDWIPKYATDLTGKIFGRTALSFYRGKAIDKAERRQDSRNVEIGQMRARQEAADAEVIAEHELESELHLLAIDAPTPYVLRLVKAMQRINERIK